MKKKVFYTELCYLLALPILAIGTALMERADFGMSMVVAPAYLLHLAISPALPFFSFGMAEYLLQLAKKYAPCTLLFGLPRNMDGTYGEQAEKVKKFAQRLIDQWDGDYAFYDERLTTMAARRVLLDADVSREKRKQVIDKMAAVVILQGYMESHRDRP